MMFYWINKIHKYIRNLNNKKKMKITKDFYNYKVKNKTHKNYRNFGNKKIIVIRNINRKINNKSKHFSFKIKINKIKLKIKNMINKMKRVIPVVKVAILAYLLLQIS